MKSIGELMGKSLDRQKANLKPAPHEYAATVNLIEENGLLSEKYGYTYWLGKIKRAEVGYAEMHSILKDISKMDKKYNKGGRLTNILTERANKRKNGKRNI